MKRNLQHAGKLGFLFNTVYSLYYNIALLLVHFPLFNGLSSQGIALTEWYCASQIMKLLKSGKESNVIFNEGLYKCSNLLEAKAYLVAQEIREDDGVESDSSFDE